MKNTIYVIALSLILAVVIFLVTRSADSGGIGSIQSGESRLVKCNNPACQAIYQMSTKDYLLQLREKVKANPMAQNPPLVCKECGHESLYRAVKCEKCGEVFFYRSVPGDFSDRCPECKFSKMEDERKAPSAR